MTDLSEQLLNKHVLQTTGVSQPAPHCTLQITIVCEFTTPVKIQADSPTLRQHSSVLVYFC